jgi:hypothetical protein
MDIALRNKLWSAIQLLVFDNPNVGSYISHSQFEWAFKRLWIHFFLRPLDRMPTEVPAFRQYVRENFFKGEWYEVYDFTEALIGELEEEATLKESLIDLINSFLEGEKAAYRIVDGQVAEITSEEEISAIEGAIDDSLSVPPVRLHLRSALSKLTDRKQPDFRNSIKESISAVEAMCRLITGDPKATLGKALKNLRDSGVQLHPTLESAWSKLYGYSSDEGGIRHALSDEGSITYADAQYMLVSCSAFVSYLIALQQQKGEV